MRYEIEKTVHYSLELANKYLSTDRSKTRGKACLQIIICLLLTVNETRPILRLPDGDSGMTT